MHWHVHDLFSRMPDDAPSGAIAVVLDVLRASTTIVTALAHGARGVLPVATVADAERHAVAMGDRAILGGERGGVRITGFDLGNSPAEYTPQRVAGKTVIITTTNGTAAVAASRAARVLLVGAIVNRAAVAAAIRRIGGDDSAVHLVCAGTDGEVSAEDVLAAGAILDAARAVERGDCLDEAARAAIALYRSVGHGDVREALVAAFGAAAGGRNLLALGLGSDLPLAAAIDSLSVVPRLDPATGMLLDAGA